MGRIIIIETNFYDCSEDTARMRMRDIEGEEWAEL